jgi:hypothetical protein
MINADARLELADDLTSSTGIASALAVAANAGEQLAAVLTFYSTDTEPFTELHRRVVEAAAEVVAAHPSAMITPRDEIRLRVVPRSA